MAKKGVMVTREQLQRIEWVGECGGHPVCPVCASTKREGHMPDCWLDTAIVDAALAAPPPVAPPNNLVAPAVGSPFPLEHSPTCGDHYDPDARCTCGLSWRIRLVTEQEHRAAWQKRAEEAEARQLAAPAPVAAPAPDGRCSRCGHYHLDGDSCGFHQCGCKTAAPAPETPAPDAMPEDVCHCGHTRKAHCWTDGKHRCYHGRCQCWSFGRRQEAQP